MTARKRERKKDRVGLSSSSPSTQGRKRREKSPRVLRERGDEVDSGSLDSFSSISTRAALPGKKEKKGPCPKEAERERKEAGTFVSQWSATQKKKKKEGSAKKMKKWKKKEKRDENPFFLWSDSQRREEKEKKRGKKKTGELWKKKTE